MKKFEKVRKNFWSQTVQVISHRASVAMVHCSVCPPSLLWLMLLVEAVSQSQPCVPSYSKGGVES